MILTMMMIIKNKIISKEITLLLNVKASHIPMFRRFLFIQKDSSGKGFYERMKKAGFFVEDSLQTQSLRKSLYSKVFNKVQMSKKKYIFLFNFQESYSFDFFVSIC